MKQTIPTLELKTPELIPNRIYHVIDMCGDTKEITDMGRFVARDDGTLKPHRENENAIQGGMVDAYKVFIAKPEVPTKQQLISLLTSMRSTVAADSKLGLTPTLYGRISSAQAMRILRDRGITGPVLNGWYDIPTLELILIAFLKDEKDGNTSRVCTNRAHTVHKVKDKFMPTLSGITIEDGKSMVTFSEPTVPTIGEMERLLPLLSVPKVTEKLDAASLFGTIHTPDEYNMSVPPILHDTYDATMLKVIYNNYYEGMELHNLYGE